jgi:hypothetical protein
MNHTPGPWINIYMNDEKNAVAFVPSPEQLAVCLDKNKTLQANAFLICAAPDLLEALQVALERLYAAEKERRYDHKTFNSYTHDLAISKAVGAINKAIGEQL